MKLEKVNIYVDKDQKNLAIGILDQITLFINKYEDINYLINNKLAESIMETLDIADFNKEFLNQEMKTELKKILKCIKKGEAITIEKAELKFEIENEYTQEILNKIPKRSTIDLSKKNDNEVLEFFQKYELRDDLLFKYKYNQNNAVKKEEIIKSIEYISNLANYIKQFNLSQLEQITLMYDLIRDREYKANKSENNLAESRDIAKIIKNEEIVCAGFTNIFSAVADRLNIDSTTQIYENKNENSYSHIANLVYVNDDKYNVHQVFEVDVTWGSKNRNNSFLDRYNSLLLLPVQAYKIKSIKDLYPFQEWDEFIKMSQQRFKKMISYGALPIIIEEHKLLLKKIKEISKKLGLIKINKRCEELLENFQKSNNNYNNENTEILTEETQKLVKNFYTQLSNTSESTLIKIIFNDDFDVINTEITKEIFIEVLYNVRRIEHLIDPKKYELSIGKIYGIAKSRYSNITYEDVIEILSNMDINNNENNINDRVEKDIKQIELVSSLKNYQKIKKQ